MSSPLLNLGGLLVDDDDDDDDDRAFTAGLQRQDAKEESQLTPIDV